MTAAAGAISGGRWAAHGAPLEPGAGGEYKWLRGFNPALTRSVHYIAHAGLRHAIGKFLDRERREVEAWIALGNDKSQFRQSPPPPSNVEQA